MSTDEHGKDQGVNVRNKVKDIISLVQDSDRLREERKKAKKSRDKYVGMSSDDVKFHSHQSGYKEIWTLVTSFNSDLLQYLDFFFVAYILAVCWDFSCNRKHKHDLLL